MSILDRLTKGRPPAAWRYVAAGPLWQVQVGSPRVLVGEVRDGTAKSASFFSVDRKTGKALWEGLNPGDPWWTGMEGIFDDVVLFHGFANPELPIHRGVHAVDALTGKLLWSDPDLRFGWCADGKIGGLALVPEQLVSRTVELRTGADADQIAGSGLLPPAAQVPGEPAGYPQPFALLEFPDAASRDRVRSRIPAEAIESSVTGVVAGGRAVISYAVSTGTTYRILLRSIVLGSASAEWEEVLLPDSPAPAPEPFFIQGDTLYAVSRRTVLVAIPLPSV